MPKKREKTLWERAVEWGLSLLDGDDEMPPRRARHKLPERADATIARVRQVNATSCGVAAAAMLARQRHDTVKAFMFPSRKRSFGTRYEDVWRALDHFGVAHEKRERKFVGWAQIPSDALVAVKWKRTPERSAYHWVIFQKRARGFQVIDPGSWGDTLRDIDLDNCIGLDFALVTPRTRDQGALKLSTLPKKIRRKRSPTRKRNGATE